ncbi:MAG TPA: hypothetical protein VFH94_30205, partial [Streptomyces sp.]|nr:hypothetical protein [Streptomyces sp.]
MVLVAALLAMAMSTAACAVAADAALRSAERMREDRYEAPARLVKDAPDSVQVSRASTGIDQVPSAVRWRTRDGSTREGQARVEPGLKAGVETMIWVDARGEPTTPPPSTVDSVLGAAV